MALWMMEVICNCFALSTLKQDVFSLFSVEKKQNYPLKVALKKDYII